MEFVSRIEINNAIEALISSDIFEVEEARKIIKYFEKLKTPGMISGETASHKKDNSSLITGCTEQNKNYTIKTDEETHSEKTYGFEIERIGYYKLYKAGDNEIVFYHFWASDITTRRSSGEIPPVFHLFYNPKTFDPISLGIAVEGCPFTLLWLPIWINRCIRINFLKRMVHIIHGEREGTHINRGYSLQVKVGPYDFTS